MYKILFRPILFLFQAEFIHNISFLFIKIICNVPILNIFIKKLFCYDNKKLEVNLFDIKFKNRIGLAAGFDKNAKILNEIEYFGFGHVEIGTITPTAQLGNQKPRLFRLSSEKALINRMGFNNDGLDKILKRIKSYKGNLVIGANIGKNKNTPNDEAINDYLICFKKLRNYVDYFVINISSPNTPQLRELQSKSNLSSLLKIIQEENSLGKIVPVLVKIAPDLSKKEIDDIIKVSIKNKIDGVVATNTTTSRKKLINDNFLVNKIGKGGLSGKPIKTKSDEMINYIRKISKGKIKIIGVGGVFNYSDFKDKIDSGADLVQIYTGWIYEGPLMVKRIIKSHLKLEN